MRVSMKKLLRAFALAAALSAGCTKKNIDISSGGESAPPAGGELPAAAAVPGASADARTPDAPVDNAAFEAWFKKYKLDLSDPKMLDADADGDGFSNRDEFLADTNPLDPNARPGIHKTIRLKEYSEVKLPIILRDVKGETAEIERMDEGGGKTEKVRVGQTIRGSSLKVARMESRVDTDKHGDKVDLSQLVLDDSASKQKFVLMKDLAVKTSATSATLTAPDGKTVKVREGETFTWPGDAATAYKVVDLREDQVVVKQVDTGAMWTIPKAEEK